MTGICVSSASARLHRIPCVRTVGRGFHGLRSSIVDGVFGHLLTQHVAVQLDQRRPGPAVSHRVKRAADLPRCQLDPVDGKRELSDFFVAPDGGEIRLDVIAAQACTTWEKDDGNSLAPGLGDTAVRVLDARPALRREHADMVARRLSTETVGGVDTASFLPEHDGPDANLGDRLDERVCRKARHPGHALGLQAARDQIKTVHSPPRSFHGRPQG